MMEHEFYKLLIEKKVNGTITDEELVQLNEHLNLCEECRNDLKEVEEMHNLISGFRYISPEDKLWEGYKKDIYAKIERSVGWIFFSLGAIIIFVGLVFYFIKDFLLDRNIPIFLRIGVILLVIGMIILLVSIIRERLFFYRNERYKEVKK